MLLGAWAMDVHAFVDELFHRDSIALWEAPRHDISTNAS